MLTHPDLDHIGGAPEVLSRLQVARVVDPGRAAGKEGFIAVLEEATVRNVPWYAAVEGGRWDLDGVQVTVLHPPGRVMGEAEASNDVSVVLLVRYGSFEALLTGDAPASVERRLVREGLVGHLDVLKVGHHGSSTSTDPTLLNATHPELALISVGKGNRYGHPDPDVVSRLVTSGADVLRTDLEGPLRVLARRDGSFDVSGRIR